MISIATSVTRCIIPKDAQKVAFLLSKVLLFKKVPKSVNIWATFERTFVTANLKKTPNLVTLIETKKQKSDDHVSRGSQPANFYLPTYSQNYFRFANFGQKFCCQCTTTDRTTPVASFGLVS